MTKKIEFDLTTRNVRCLKQTGLWPAFNAVFHDASDAQKEKAINTRTVEEFDKVIAKLITARDMMRDQQRQR